MPYGTETRGPIRLLYIDDDVGLGILVKKLLERQDHSVITVTDGAQAVIELAKQHFDIIALDHSLKSETGLDVLRQLGPRGPRPPVIYVSGSADARIAIDAIRSGADDYIIKDGSGEFFEFLIASAHHVLERWRLQRQRAENERETHAAKERAELLLKEVNHRVANSLGLVAGMVRMQANALEDAGAIKALQETQLRINAIAGVHRWLYTSDQVGLVQLSEYLANLTGELKDSLVDETRPLTIRLQVDPLLLPTDKVVSLGVIVGELVTNAFKYAYDAGQAGEVGVLFTCLGDGKVQLVVEDDGRGFVPNGPARGSGLGTKILRAMARNLDATVTHDTVARGSRIVVSFDNA